MVHVKTVLLMAVVLGVQYTVAISEENRELESDKFNLEKRNQEAECTDIHDRIEPGKCKEWAEIGECTINYEWMSINCIKSCGLCGCIDKYDLVQEEECTKWAANGECYRNYMWMTHNCRKSCGWCECDNYDDRCYEFAWKGECGKSTDLWMQQCPRSCGKCDCPSTSNCEGSQCFDLNSASDCLVWSRCGYCNGESTRLNCPKTCGVCNNNQVEAAPATCQDWLSENTCNEAALGGDCKGDYMFYWMTACMETCGGCKWMEHKNENECAYAECGKWKEDGKCENEPCFMNRYCGSICQGGECKNIAVSGPKPLCIEAGTCDWLLWKY